MSLAEETPELGCSSELELLELSHLTPPWESSQARTEVAKAWLGPRGVSPHTHSCGCRGQCAGSPLGATGDAGG